MPQSDVLIVGGGPAGAWAAYRLARAGARVTLFDDSHPREKPCGGGLTGRAVDAVREVLNSAPRDGVVIDGLRFESGDAATEMRLPTGQPRGRHAEAPLRDSLLVVDRRSFDARLLAAAVEAGARHVKERARDVEVEGPPQVATRSGRWAGDWLLAADGANSLVRRRLGTPFTRAQLSIATGYFIHGRSESTIRIRTVSNPPGYLWSFPRRTHLAAGICAQADATSVAPLRTIVHEWVRASGLANGKQRLEPYSWPIPSLRSRDFAVERASRGRVLLLGDAAGLVDPLTREGIYYALESASFASQSLSAAAGQAGTSYAERLRDLVYPELARAADLKVRFFTSGFTDLLVSGLHRSESVRAVMADLVAGEQPYGTLKGRLARTFEVKLALQLLSLQVAGWWTRRRPL